jgi:diguanylate cyclase (GGDEF)-like protein/putative nucleotidyltransferase with HDIG domain
MDFLEEKNTFTKYLWMLLHIGVFVFNCMTCWFIPEPEVVYNGPYAQFQYHYSWHIYILGLLMLPCLLQMVAVVHRHCKGNSIAMQQLKPVLQGILYLLVGHILSTFPFFLGFPLDIASGIVNVLFVFYALYNKRLFRMTLLFSRSNYLLFALTISGFIFYHIAAPVQQFFIRAMGMEHTLSVVFIAAAFFATVLLIYCVLAWILNSIFIRNEQQHMQRINQLGDDVTHIFSVNDILQNMTDVILQTTHVERIAIFIRQPDGDYRVEFTTNPLDEKGFYLQSDHPLVSYFRRSDQYATLRDFSRATVFRSLWESERKLLASLKAECFVPLSSEKDLVGIIVLPERKDFQPYHDNDLALVQTIASICATAVRDAAIYERSITEARRDRLTGLLNRKFFLELVDREFEQYKNTAISLCLFNVDDFKLYNQLYGSQEGDLALSRIAGLLRSAINDTCHAARVGGKEFALLLPGYDIHSAKLLAENLAAEVTELNKRNGGQVTKTLTVSAGICAAPYMASSAKELFQNAETAVYTVKQSGKNAVQVYSSEIFRKEVKKDNSHRSGYGENANTIYALTAAINTRDHYTFQHSQNVAYYATELTRATGMGDDLLEIVKEAGLLHDIGKIGVREDILNKPGKLSAEEFDIMKGHVVNAVNIIRYLPSLDYVIPAVLSHHERYDGKGYPRQLSGDEIPILGRILCIADSFDAMTSARSYKSAVSVQTAITILNKESGKQFDPKLVRTFIDLLEKGKIEIRSYHDDQSQNAPVTNNDPDIIPAQ